MHLEVEVSIPTTKQQQSFEFFWNVPYECLPFMFLGVLLVVVYTHSEKCAAARVCVKLLRRKIYARLGVKTVSNDATRGRVQAAEAWLTVWHSFLLNSEIWGAAASGSHSALSCVFLCRNHPEHREMCCFNIRWVHCDAAVLRVEMFCNAVVSFCLS